MSERQMVYLVEFRQHKPHRDDPHFFTSDVMHIASTEEKARQWCRANSDLDAHDPDKWWWFTIIGEYVDEDDLANVPFIFHVDWDGVGTNRGLGNVQPIYGYNFDYNSFDGPPQPPDDDGIGCCDELHADGDSGEHG